MTFLSRVKLSGLLIAGLLPACSATEVKRDVASSAKAEEPTFSLMASDPISIAGAGAHFDYLEFDRHRNRVLAAHPGSGKLEILNLQDHSLRSVAVGEAHGVAVDDGDKVYIAGVGEQKEVVFVNPDTLKREGKSVRVPGPVDSIAFDPKNGNVYAAEDDGKRIWAISVQHRKVLATITLQGVPEYLAFDGQRNRIFVNVKTRNTVAVINPSTNAVEGEWSTMPAERPHGLAVDESRGRLFIAGANGKLVSLDAHNGEKLSTLDIAEGTDQISYDPFARKIYCASKGFLVTALDTDKGLTLAAQTPTPKGAHTVTTDPSSQSVWVAYPDDKQSFLQELKPHGRNNEKLAQ